MSKYCITFSCGHEGTVNIIGKQSYREWRLKRYCEYGICEECRKKAIDEKNARMLAEAKEMGLPSLIGSDKQIPWAITIRQGFIESIETYAFKNDECKVEYADTFQKILEKETSARFWIDNRDKSIVNLIKKEFERKGNLIDNSTIAELSKEEMTISLDNVTHDGRVEVVVSDDLVKAIYERDSDFIKLVKKLRFKWNGDFWYRKINEFTGSQEDRASELIASLLKFGFRVYCSDERAKKMAIEGTYKLENDYWIIGIEDKKLGIKMFQRNNDIYQKSRVLPNNKWSTQHNCVVIDVSHYKDVLDFAKTFGFSVSNKAKKNIEIEIERENNNLKVAINSNKNVHTNSYKLLDNLLTENYNIIEDLIDD